MQVVIGISSLLPPPPFLLLINKNSIFLTLICYEFSQSKFVSEMLVRQAHSEWEVPAIIFRPTTIAGDTKSGYSNLRDSINIVISGIAKLGK
jgi:hypothetical protein